MSEDTTAPTSETSTVTPDNVIPLPVDTATSPDLSPAPEVASDASETPAASQEGQSEDPVQAAIKGIDLDKMTKDDIFVDIIHQSKLHAFRLMVGAALLEQLIIKGRNEAAAAAPAPDAAPAEA